MHTALPTGHCNPLFTPELEHPAPNEDHPRPLACLPDSPRVRLVKDYH